MLAFGEMVSTNQSVWKSSLPNYRWQTLALQPSLLNHDGDSDEKLKKGPRMN